LELAEIIKSRRSIRKFTDADVPDEIIQKLAEAARWAPSPTNRQGTEIIVIRNRDLKDKMAEVVKQSINELETKVPNEDALQTLRDYGNYFTFFKEAPVVLVITYRPKQSITGILTGSSGKPRDYIADISGTAAAIQNILLTAHSLGYGTCWMTGPLIAEEPLADLLEIRPPRRLAAIVPLGIPAEQPEAPKRKDIDSIFRVVE